MQSLLTAIKILIQRHGNQMPLAVHFAIGWLEKEIELGDQKQYSTEDVLDMLKLIVKDSEEVEKEEAAPEVRVQEQPGYIPQDCKGKVFVNMPNLQESGSVYICPKCQRRHERVYNFCIYCRHQLKENPVIVKYSSES